VKGEKLTAFIKLIEGAVQKWTALFYSNCFTE